MNNPDHDTLTDQCKHVAGQLLAAHGMAWTMAEVAAQVGITRGHLYRLYLHRADLMSHVLDRTVTDEDMSVLASVRWGTAWKPATVQDWADVHALLTEGHRRT